MNIRSNFLAPVLGAAWLAAFTLASNANAQTTAPVGGAPPATDKPATELYQSAFKGYQPYTDEKLTDWKVVNGTVERIGGWREYAKQAQQPANTPTPASKAGEATRQVKP